MCGIAATIGGTREQVEAMLNAQAARGPDGEGIAQVGAAILGHRRLAILDPSPASAQPIRVGPVTLAFAGEVWNYRALREGIERDLGHQFHTTGDAEVFAAALARWGIAALGRIEGMFAAVWTDDSADGGSALYVARDRFGEIPLHRTSLEGLFRRPPLIATEIKALLAAGADPAEIEWVDPGSVLVVLPEVAHKHWYYGITTDRRPGDSWPREYRLHELLGNACQERAISDVPVCALLSGGLDSSALCAFLRTLIPGLVVYTAFHDDRSADLLAARAAAKYLDLELREVFIPEPTAEDLAYVVRVIEMPYKVQVEIGWPCLVLADRIAYDGFKVAFVGEGSDELWASYGFSQRLRTNADWERQREYLVRRQHRMNFARANKAFLSRGVEPRLPFMHRPLVEWALGLPRASIRQRGRPKAILQDALRGVLPDAIVDRRKLAFQDGLGIKAGIAARLSDPAAFYHKTWLDTLNGKE